MDGGADKRGPVLAKEDCRTTDLACKVVQAADTVIDMVWGNDICFHLLYFHFARYFKYLRCFERWPGKGSRMLTKSYCSHTPAD